MLVRLIVVALLSLVVTGNAGAQVLPQNPVTNEIMNFSVQMSAGLQRVALGASKDLPTEGLYIFKITDQSTDPNAPVNTFTHFVTTTSYFRDNSPPLGWSLQGPFLTGFPTNSGTTVETFMKVEHVPTVTQSFVDGFVNVTMERLDPPGSVTKLLYWAVQIAPTPGARIEVGDDAPKVVQPNQFIRIPVTITNLDFYPDSYRVTARILESEGVTPENVIILGLGDYYLEPGETKQIVIGIQTPREKTWYSGSQLVILFDVQSASGQGSAQSDLHFMTLQGFYFSENLVLIVTAFLVQIALIILAVWWFLRWRGENVYGKPIPPWKIPEEKSHLERLKREDPRAHYVLRYYLMEEEYRSALLWYYAFKRVSKRQLKAEARALELRERAAELEVPDLAVFDRREARLKRSYASKIERLKARVEKRLAGLQAKLDRTYERDYEKDHEKWAKTVERLKAKAAKPVEKERRRWEKERQRILAAWEKPFAKDKKRHARELAAAKQRYAKLVRKKDKPTWKVWREKMEDWEVENRLRKKEGKDFLPEPELLSSAVPREGFPEPFKLPPKPELPHEPNVPELKDLPREPERVKPTLEASHYARKARRLRKREIALVKRLRGELAIALEAIGREREKAGREASVRRESYLSAATGARGPGMVDRILGRTPERQERRHHVAFIRGQTKQRMRELEAAERAAVQRVHLEGERKEAELEAKAIRARAALHRAARMGGADVEAARADVARLEEELKATRARNVKRLGEAKTRAEKRIEEGRAELKAREEVRLAAEKGGAEPASETSSRA